MDNNHFFSLISQDIDEIPRFMPAWEVEWCQLSRGAFEAQLKSAQFDGVELFYLNWNQAVHIQGSLPPDTISFGIEVTSPGRAIWRGLEYREQDILITSDREFDLKAPAGYEMFTVMVKRDLLLEHAEWQQRRLHQQDLSKSLGRVNSATLNAIKAYLQTTIAMLELNTKDGKEYPHTHSVTQDIISLLITVLLSTDNCSMQCPHSLQRARLVKQLKEYMLAHIDKPLTIEQLCIVAGISERSLNNYFHDLLDISPIAYFKALRFNRVRSALKLADPTADRVASIAKQYGFQHMGYFAVDYKTMFGESPSTTLWRSIEQDVVLQNFDSGSC